MFILLMNGSVYQCNYFDTIEEIENVLNDLSDGEDLINDENEEITIDQLQECGNCGEQLEIVNKNMVEMGDDYVQISIVELTKYKS